MEEKQVTLKDLVGMTIDDLKTLSIPASMLDQFGPPISRALRNLKIIADAFENAEKQQSKTEQKDETVSEEDETKTEDEPKIEIVE